MCLRLAMTVLGLFGSNLFLDFNPGRAGEDKKGDVQRAKLIRISGPPGEALTVISLASMPESAPLTTPFRHEGAARQLAFSPDGKKLAAISGKGVLIWDALTGQVVRRLVTPNHCALLDFSPKGDVVVVFSAGDITFWDVGTGKNLRPFEVSVDEALNPMYSGNLRFSPDGKFLVIHAWSSSAYLLDASQGKPVRRFGGTAEVHDVAFSTDGKQLALATLDPSVQVFDLGTAKRLHKLDPEKGRFAYSVCFDKKSRRIAAGGWDRITMSDVDGTSVGVFKAKMEAVTRLAFAANGRLLLSGSQDGKIRVWDIAAGKVLRSYSGSHWALSPDGKTLAVDTERTIRLWDVVTGKERSKIRR
jgi:WD40 repeat protein